MNEGTYRLKSSAVVEPLIGKWWAWSHLISPAAASLHLAHYQIPALESYLLDPESHVRACRDPELIGGAFVDISPDRAGEVDELLRETQRRRGPELRLAGELTSFSERLAQMAAGQSLEPVYQTVPEPLQGCVELVYDYLHRGSYRIIEKLLYSRYYQPGLQSLRLFNKNSARPFFMSTPRLTGANDYEWKLAFADPRLDQLFRTDLSPAPLTFFRELMGVDDSKMNVLADLLERTDRPSGEIWNGKGIRVRHFGHACMLVEWNGTSILTDPVIETNPGTRFHGFDELPPRIDFALITHNHQDHLSLETLLRLRSRIGAIVVPKSMGLLYGDLSLRAMLEAVGFQGVIEMDTLDSISIPGGAIVAAPFLGEHADLAHGKTGYVVRAGKHQMWFAADSDCLEPATYRQLRSAIGRIDTLFVGCESVGAPLSWSCGPFFPRKPPLELETTRRYHGCNAQAAMELAEAVGARRIFNYAMGLEPWMEFILGLCMTPAAPQWQESEKLLAQANRRGLVAERPFGRWERVFDAGDAEVFCGWAPLGPARGRAYQHATVPGLAGVVPPDVVTAARNLARQLDCSLPSVYLAALCVVESEVAAEEVPIAVVDGHEKSTVVSIDLSGNPAFCDLIERVEVAVARAPECGAEAGRGLSLQFSGYSPTRADKTLSAIEAIRWVVARDGDQVSLATPNAPDSRLDRYLAVLERGVREPSQRLKELSPDGTAAAAEEAEFAF
jgi:L-ascorbate metabolism protein UlaG (beta-lactamase superfamily)